jgi:hypothetical protein
MMVGPLVGAILGGRVRFIAFSIIGSMRARGNVGSLPMGRAREVEVYTTVMVYWRYPKIRSLDFLSIRGRGGSWRGA